VIAIAVTFFAFIAGNLVDDFLMGETRQVLFSDVLTSLITGILAFFAARYYDIRRRAIAERLRITAEVNHHVRNALTGIFYSVEARKDPELLQITQEAVERIDWVLREVLPSPEITPAKEVPKRERLVSREKKRARL
jgi:hypothetical protein